MPGVQRHMQDVSGVRWALAVCEAIGAAAELKMCTGRSAVYSESVTHNMKRLAGHDSV
jgi:hypothetical protein